MAKRKASVPSMEERADPKLRGVHRDGIQADVSPSSRAECVDCGKPIAKGSARWGIKYGGNPLTGIGAGVMPLYGTHPHLAPLSMKSLCVGKLSAAQIGRG
mmetsp:Transcript_33042/g.71507  ORF Transcript_33042/g.71507 Transcript_33042/m.71507 type:complete len:101 (+) Transcript_33042:26-328(+)